MGIGITDGLETECGGGVGQPPVSGTGAPTDAPYVTYTATAGLTNEFSLGTLQAGLLKQTVSSGTATISVVPDSANDSGDVLTWNGSAWAPLPPAATIDPYTSTPAAIGTASAGSSDDYARGDHVHAITGLTAGAVVVGSGSGGVSSLANGSNTQVLTMVAGAPAWASASSAAYYQTLKANGTPQTQRAAINFASLFSLTDVSGSDHTTLDLATNMVAFNRLQQITGPSVLGKADAGAGNVANIGTASSGQVLRHNGTQLEWGTLLATSFADNTIVPARLTTQAAKSVIGVTGNATAAPAAIAGATGGHVLRINAANDTLEFGTLVSTSFADGTISGTRLSGFTASQVVIGDPGSGGGISVLSAGTNGHVLTMTAGAPAWAAPSGGGTIDGSGAATRLAIWSDSDTLTSSADLVYDDTTNTLTLAASESGGSVDFLVSNSSNTASSAASIESRVAGSSASNPRVRANISGLKTFDLMVDNAASDTPELQVDGTVRAAFPGSGLLTVLGGASSAVSLTNGLEVRSAEHQSIYCYTNGSTKFSEIVAYADSGGAHAVSIVACGTGNAYGNMFGTATTEWQLVRGYGTSAGMKIGTTAASPVQIGAGDNKRIEIPSATTSPVTIIDATGATVSF